MPSGWIISLPPAEIRDQACPTRGVKARRHRGPTYPYTDSLVTAHRVLGGDRVSAGRSDIEAEFADLPPAPPMALGDHGELVITAAQEIADALAGHPISRTLPK